MLTPTQRRSVSAWMFTFCGVWLIGLGLYFIFLRPPLLPEDLRYMKVGPGEIQFAAPGLERWLQKVFKVMGGFIAGAGALTLLVARNKCAVSEKWNRLILVVVGALTVGLMSITNFQIHSDFNWMLLMPSILWAVALAYPSSASRAERAHLENPKSEMVVVAGHVAGGVVGLGAFHITWRRLASTLKGLHVRRSALG